MPERRNLVVLGAGQLWVIRTAVLAAMCHCRGLDQGRDLAAGLPGRPVVIFQPRNLPEVFVVPCRICPGGQGMGTRGWAWLVWLQSKYTPKSL